MSGLVLSAAFACQGDYVVGFEPVDNATVGIFLTEFFFQRVVVEVGCEMGEFSVEFNFVGPDFVAGVEEVADDGIGVYAVERAVIYADVVEA